MQKSHKHTENESESNELNKSADDKAFVGMGIENPTAESGRSSEEVRKSRLANTDEEGGTHGGSKSSGAKVSKDKGGAEGNEGTHPF